MYGEYMIFFACDLESKANTLFSLSGVSGELTCLGEIEVPYAEGGYFNPALLTQQFLSDEKGIYLTAACFKGRAAALCSYVCVGAVPGEENSAYVITDITQADPDLPSDLIEVPTLDLFEPGEPEIVNAKRGTLALSKDYCGDLVYIDSPYSAWVLRKDYVKEYDYWDEDSPIEIIQDMSVIDDTAYVIRDPGGDAGRDPAGRGRLVSALRAALHGLGARPVRPGRRPDGRIREERADDGADV